MRPPFGKRDVLLELLEDSVHPSWLVKFKRGACHKHRFVTFLVLVDYPNRGIRRMCSWGPSFVLRKF